ncbi:MAG: YHS domain-containing protein [Candidatus Omnitrophica bacterium]|nr:YHS domain-containing protein [Candidatus Omnitrophota bacterium]MCB9721907.1 YHS domain-containing protein [Candidatus Omnitrophota bacterium]
MHGLAFGYRYKGKKYKFCSMECLKAFKANPEKFLDDNYMAHGHDGEDHAGHDHGEHEKH